MIFSEPSELKNQKSVQPSSLHFSKIKSSFTGFTKEEILYLKKDLKAIGITLNKNTLRAETAAIAAIAITSLFLQS